MDDDLLADDGQFKDEGLDDLDLDEEAALLGLSDEEIEDKNFGDDDQELEYVDEEGNPVEIGKNNANLYELAEVNKSRNSSDDDILDLDLDGELDSFIQDGPEISEKKTPVKSYEKQQKRNLISLTSQVKVEKTSPLKRKDSFPKSHIGNENTSSTIAYVSKRLTSSSPLASHTYESNELEFDEESEDESMEDDHRERFKSERSNIITLTPAKKRADIPDTLDSVISVEETAKVQAFLENEQRRKMRFKGRPLPRMKSGSYSRQPFMNKPPSQPPPPPSQHQPSQYSSSTIPDSSHNTSPTTQSRKILVNPHFRGVLVPPASSTGPENPPVSISAYDQPAQNIMPPMYTHQDTPPQISVPPPTYNAPSNVQYNTPDYPPQLNVQQAPIPIWSTPPPEILPPVSYSNPPPPVMNYGTQHPNYQSNYNANSFTNTNYSTPPPPIPVPQPVSYNQPPPPLHIPGPTYTSPPMQTNTSHLMHSVNQTNVQQNNILDPYSQQSNVPQSAAPTLQQNRYSSNNSNRQNQIRSQQQNLRPMQQNLRPLQQNQQSRLLNQQQRRFNQRGPNQQQNQRFLRQGEKRSSNSNIKEVPIKMARYDSMPLKKNIRASNSNIKEIPLVEYVTTVQTPVAKVSTPVIEEEDEETKELRMKIEEQKRLREQILKQKEMRRRQMASQRLVELKKRQAEQNKNVISLTGAANPTMSAKQPIPIQKPAPTKLSVKERIGLPRTNIITPGTKKIVVLKKKPEQTANTEALNESKNVLVSGLRTGAQSANQTQNTLGVRNLNVNNTVKPNITTAKTVITAVPTKKKIISLKKITSTKDTSSTTNSKPIKIEGSNNVVKLESNPIKSEGSNSVVKLESKPIKIEGSNNVAKSNLKQNQKGPVQSRLGNRPNFQKKNFKSPRIPFQQRPRTPSRFQGNRRPQFPSSPPFMDHRMRNPTPGPHMNDMRMPLQSSPPFYEPRPPLLPFRPPGERPPFNEFMFEQNPPQFRPPGPSERHHPQFIRPGGPHQFPGPMELSNRQFRPQGPGFQNFRPRGKDMFPPDRFPPPHFQNQMSPPRHMFEPNNQMQQRPRFYQGSNRTQRFSKPNFNQQRKMPDEKKNLKCEDPQNETKFSKESIHIKQEIEISSIKKEDDFNTSTIHTVEVGNLSSSTNEVQLRKLCATVGVVENIQLMKSDRKAVIKFKEAQQAIQFHKKYQRYMLDLSMIQVSLVPV